MARPFAHASPSPSGWLFCLFCGVECAKMMENCLTDQQITLYQFSPSAFVFLGANEGAGERVGEPTPMMNGSTMGQESRSPHPFGHFRYLSLADFAPTNSSRHFVLTVISRRGMPTLPLNLPPLKRHVLQLLGSRSDGCHGP